VSKLQIPYNITFPPTPNPPHGLFRSGFSTKILYAFFKLFSSMQISAYVLDTCYFISIHSF